MKTKRKNEWTGRLKGRKEGSQGRKRRKIEKKLRRGIKKEKKRREEEKDGVGSKYFRNNKRNKEK